MYGVGGGSLRTRRLDRRLGGAQFETHPIRLAYGLGLNGTGLGFGSKRTDAPPSTNPELKSPLVILNGPSFFLTCVSLASTQIVHSTDIVNTNSQILGICANPKPSHMP